MGRSSPSLQRNLLEGGHELIAFHSPSMERRLFGSGIRASLSVGASPITSPCSSPPLGRRMYPSIDEFRSSMDSLVSAPEEFKGVTEFSALEAAKLRRFDRRMTRRVRQIPMSEKLISSDENLHIHHRQGFHQIRIKGGVSGHRHISTTDQTDISSIQHSPGSRRRDRGLQPVSVEKPLVFPPVGREGQQGQMLVSFSDMERGGARLKTKKQKKIRRRSDRQYNDESVSEQDTPTPDKTVDDRTEESVSTLSPSAVVEHFEERITVDGRRVIKLTEIPKKLRTSKKYPSTEDFLSIKDQARLAPAGSLQALSLAIVELGSDKSLVKPNEAIDNLLCEGSKEKSLTESDTCLVDASESTDKATIKSSLYIGHLEASDFKCYPSIDNFLSIKETALLAPGGSLQSLALTVVDVTGVERYMVGASHISEQGSENSVNTGYTTEDFTERRNDDTSQLPQASVGHDDTDIGASDTPGSLKKVLSEDSGVETEHDQVPGKGTDDRKRDSFTDTDDSFGKDFDELLADIDDLVIESGAEDRKESPDLCLYTDHVSLTVTLPERAKVHINNSIVCCISDVSGCLKFET